MSQRLVSHRLYSWLLGMRTPPAVNIGGFQSIMLAGFSR